MSWHMIHPHPENQKITYHDKSHTLEKLLITHVQ